MVRMLVCGKENSIPCQLVQLAIGTAGTRCYSYTEVVKANLGRVSPKVIIGKGWALIARLDARFSCPVSQACSTQIDDSVPAILSMTQMQPAGKGLRVTCAAVQYINLFAIGVG